MDTPIISHITFDDYDHVYEPAQDSFLLLDALETDMNNILSQKPLFCVEIGVGSGVILTALAKLLKSTSHCLGIDISPYACKIAKKTSDINRVNIDIANMDLLEGLRDNSVDLLIFNPPYVPSRTLETQENTNLESHNMVVSNVSIIGTWAGGVNGREVIDRVVCKLDQILATGGVFYLLLLKENRPNEIVTSLITRGGFTAEVLIERRIIGEHLFIVKIVKTN